MEFWQGPDAATLKVIKDELREDENRMGNNLQLLEEWISYQKHLPNNYDKRILPIYLRGCKHDMDKTKRKIELFFIAKQHRPEIFANFDMASDIHKNAEKALLVGISSKLTPEGYRVITCKISGAGAEYYDVTGIIKRNFKIHELQNAEEYPNAGYVFIVDDEHFNGQHLARTLHPVVKKATVIAEEAFPFRIKQIHIVNANPFVIKCVNFVKSFMKEKLRKRFHIHKDTSGLLDYLPAKVLPAEYGGLEPSIEEMSQTTRQILLAKQKYLQEQESIKVRPELIPDKYQSTFGGGEDEGCGVSGSFRKLNLD